MLGMAQRLFIERTSKNLWRSHSQHHYTSDWPFLDRMLISNRLDYIDFALAQKLLSFSQRSDEAIAAFICHLSMASRQGHLCITIDREQNILTPSVDEVWLLAGEHLPGIDKLPQSEVDALKTLILDGSSKISAPLIEEADRITTSSLVPVYRCKNNYYLQRYWQLECTFVDSLNSFLSNKEPNFLLDIDGIRSFVERQLDEKKLLPEQAQAVIQGCVSPFTIITGGPGTGKTHTAGILLRAFWEGLTATQKTQCRIELAAPTGKAAANLEMSIQRALRGIEGFPLLKAKTLHSLLGIRQNESWSRVPPILQTDFLLVDESSMIDVRIMGKLIASLKPGTQVILLGDSYQLPPVDAGSIFSDLVVYMQSNEETRKHLIELKTCLRAELKAITQLADKIKQGDEQGVLDLFENKTGDQGILFNPLKDDENIKNIQRRLLHYALPHFIDGSHSKDPVDILNRFGAFRILTPMRKGPFGVEELNALFFQEIASKNKNHETFAVPIIITQNDYRLELFNGEVGILILHQEKDKGKDRAFFNAKDAGGGLRQISAILLPKYEYAYCLSIHKSQGSEFDQVVVILTEGSEVFGREALYTGVTRAKRSLEIWARPSIMRQMILRNAHRNSGVVKRLSIGIAT